MATIARRISVIDKDKTMAIFCQHPHPVKRYKAAEWNTSEKQVSVAFVRNLKLFKMASILKLTVILGMFVSVLSKKLHIKEDLETKNKETKGFMNLFNDEDMFPTNDRYARHMQVVTESILDHLIKEIKQEYQSTNYNSNSPIRRLIRNLNKEMKKNEHNKMVKQKLKKKAARKGKSKSSKKNKKLSTKKPQTYL